MKKLVFFTAFFCCAALYAQTAQSLTVILAEKNALWEHLTYLVQTQQGSFAGREPDSVFTDSFELCQKSGAFSKKTAPGSALTFAGAAGFLMRYYNVRGGFLYAMGKTDWYAFKFLKNQGLINYETEPDEKISGIELVNLMGDFSAAFLPDVDYFVPALLR